MQKMRIFKNKKKSLKIYKKKLKSEMRMQLTSQEKNKKNDTE